MMSQRVTSPVEEEEADVDEADWDGAEREGEAADLDYLDLNCTSLRFKGQTLERKQKNGIRSS